MHQITRKGTTLGGTFTVYDGKEDAIANGIPAERIKKWKDHSMQIGDWVEYPDGMVSEVIRCYACRNKSVKAKFVTTRLNCFSQSQSVLSSACVPYSSPTAHARPETISTNRIKFSEGWLLQGMSIEQSCRKFLWQARMGQKDNYTYRRYAYLVLSLPWFDELLKSNRLIRDRYMSLVGALNSEGVNEAYIASQLKKDIEGDDSKAHINAINKAIDLLEANAPRKRQSISTTWQELPPTPKQIESANINAILERTINVKAIGSESDLPSRSETVPTEHQGETGRSTVSETERNAPIFIGASN